MHLYSYYNLYLHLRKYGTSLSTALAPFIILRPSNRALLTKRQSVDQVLI